MKTLLLLRHAKAEQSAPGGDDHDRPLTPRGEHAALAAGRAMAAAGLAPDLALCSTAVRAEATLRLAASELPAPPPTRTDRGLYLAGRQRLLAALADVEEPTAAVLLVGHNPDMHELAASLAADGDPPLIAALRSGFPTACLAVLELPIAAWSEVVRARGRLVAFVPPAG